jgi:hypothetical protein
MTYPFSACEFGAYNHLLNLQRLQNRFPAPLEVFRGASQYSICTWLSNFRTYIIIKQNFAGNKQKSYKIIKMQLFATLDKANPDEGNKRGLNFGDGQAYDRSSV